MGTVSWVKELRSKIRLTEPPDYKPERPWSKAKREILLDRATWDAIDTYDTSTPTGPSAGRIYKRRNFTVSVVEGRQHVEWHEDDGYVYIVINAPDGDGQLHVPYRAVIA